MESKTLIHNECYDVPLFLIPYRRRSGDTDGMSFPVEYKMGKKIEVRGCEVVHSGKESRPGADIYILFRAGKRDDNGNAASVLQRDYPNGVSHFLGEKAYIYSQLFAKENWYLSHAIEGQGLAVHNHAGQGVQNQYEYLRGEVKRLNGQVQALEEKITALEKLLNDRPS